MTPSHTSARWRSVAIHLVILIGLTSTTFAKPRSPLPPWPQRELAGWRFDGWDRQIPNTTLLRADNLVVEESWSWHALHMSGKGPSLLAIPQIAPAGRTNFPSATGTVRFWFAPDWNSVNAGGNGPGDAARLLEYGAWSEQTAETWLALGVNDTGTRLSLHARSGTESLEILAAPIDWCAGEWHQVTLLWSPEGTALYLDGRKAAAGQAIALVPLSKFGGVPGVCLGSDVHGGNLAQGAFEELYSFARVCRDWELADDYQRNAPRTTLGPVTPEEEGALRVAADQARSARMQLLAAAPAAPESMALLGGCDPCAAKLTVPVISLVGGQTVVTIQIVDGVPNFDYDLYMAVDLQGDSLADADWTWVATGHSGDTLTVTPGGIGPAPAHAFFILSCEPDDEPNVLVNNPDFDSGNEQNTQFESTCALLNGKVIVAWVDSNKSVYGLGSVNYEGFLPNRSPDGIGYAVSHDGGLTFQDMGEPPRGGFPDPEPFGVPADPILAVDTANNKVYLVRTSPRQLPQEGQPGGQRGFPFWRSTDGGVSFTRILPNAGIFPNGGPSIETSDRPWMAVDDTPGEGHGDIFVVGHGKVGTVAALWLIVSSDSGDTWSPPLEISDTFTSGSVIQVGPEHVLYAVWLAVSPTLGGPHFLRTRRITASGTALGDMHDIVGINTGTGTEARFRLKRSNTAAEDDRFNVYPAPVLAVNQARSGHLYVASNELGVNPGDGTDVFFVRSDNGGDSWTPKQPLSDVTASDQWMPVLAVKPDGTQLFAAWYDRRNDPNNSLIDLYGRWGVIDTEGVVSFGPAIRITTSSFPPVFAGTRAITQPLYKENGYYDPVWPPGDVNLNWWYSEWTPPESDPDDNFRTFSAWEGHVGEYNGAVADMASVYVTWTDNRRLSCGTLVARNQSDIRCMRLSWPE